MKNQLVKLVTESGVQPVSIFNIEIAIQHFKFRSSQTGGIILAQEVFEVLNFLQQAEKQKLKVIGIGYRRYDNILIEDTPTGKIYDGGFIVL